MKSPLEAIFDFLKVLGGSLTGLTAVFTATGFLIERARLTMLGLPSTTFDLERYVETGARFFAFLPVLLSYPLKDVGVELVGAIAVLLLGGALVALIKQRRDDAPAKKTSSADAKTTLSRTVGKPEAREEASGTETTPDAGKRSFLAPLFDGLRPVYAYLLMLGLVLLVAFQFYTMHQQVNVLVARDMLFEERDADSLVADTLVADSLVAGCLEADTSRAAAPSDTAGFASAESIEQLINAIREGIQERQVELTRGEQVKQWLREGDDLQSLEFFVLLFLGVLGAALLHVLILRLRPIDQIVQESLSQATRWKVALRALWLGIGVPLLAAQLVLMLSDYGFLVSTTRFPEVCVGFTEAVQTRPDPPPAVRLALVHEGGGGYYFYLRSKRQMWYVRYEDIESLVHHRLIDVLTEETCTPCRRALP